MLIKLATYDLVLSLHASGPHVTASFAGHPLDSLSATEITAAAAVCKLYAESQGVENLRFNIISLQVCSVGLFPNCSQNTATHAAAASDDGRRIQSHIKFDFHIVASSVSPLHARCSIPMPFPT